jgi:hypothetical protein
MDPLIELEDWQVVKLHTDQMRGLEFASAYVCSTGKSEGQALWVACLADDRRVGIAFPWIRVAPRIALVSDIQRINTNALLSDDSGPLSVAGHVACMAHILFVLPWQRQVLGRFAS